MAQILIKFQEMTTHTVMVEGVDTLDEAKAIVSNGPQPVDGSEHDSWFGTVHHVSHTDLERPIIASDEVNLAS